MELLNATKMLASYTMGVDKAGRESLVVVIKGTYQLPMDGNSQNEEAKLADQQQPLVEADQFSGEPGYSAALYESEYAPFKPRCDVLLNGSAYAPDGKPAGSVEAGFKLSTISKVIKVVGNRLWYTGGGGGISITKAHPFVKMNITYDVAFGGMDNFHSDPSKHDAYMPNPVGRGFHRNLTNDLVHNTPLPNTEERGKAIKNPDGSYKPVAFGPLGRGWADRLQYAGTYDQKWIDDVFPFLPADFDDRYFQAAPADQQCDYLKGGELVQLLNLTASGSAAFRIPNADMPVVFFRKRGGDEHKQAVIDTLLIEPEKGVFSIVWRCSLPLKKNMFEIPQVLVGNKSRAWWRARTLGKTYYKSLADITSSQGDDDD